jgi:hypothetical protein
MVGWQRIATPQWRPRTSSAISTRPPVTTVAGVATKVCAGSQIRGDLSHDDTPTRNFRVFVKAASYLRIRLRCLVVI